MARIKNRLGARSQGTPGRLVTAVVAGAGADANIAVTGIRKRDEIQSVIELASPSDASADAVVADRTAASSIFADNVIRCTAATTGHQLLVHYWDLT